MIGLVESLSRTNSNVTGVSMMISALVAKRLEIMRDVMPNAMTYGFLRNARNTLVSGAETDEVQRAASDLGVRLVVADASAPEEFENAFGLLDRGNVEVLIGSGEAAFWFNRHYLVSIAARRRMPAIYAARQYVEVGGLFSFGVRLRDGYQAIGAYAARILKGAKPSELPVVQVTKTELLVNLRVAKALDVKVTPPILARADEVIE